MNNNNSKRYLPHELQTRIKAVTMYRNNNDINYTCRKYHISRVSLWRWNKKYDGTKESLLDKSHKPIKKHPTAHTDQEIKFIKDYVRRNKKITLNELWYKLKREKNYTRNITSLYRVMKKQNILFDNGLNIKHTSKRKHNKKYHTPDKIGEKWQIDVKYVPNICKVNLPADIRYYQYTCIDECDRERFLYWYADNTPANAEDFVKKCVKYFKYKPSIIQTDNGIEFTYNQSKVKKEHPLDTLLNELNITHKKIRPYTPEHNGKVERSHRSDNERFYSYLKFYSLEDLRKQGKQYLKRSNNIPMSVLGYLTPVEKRQQLLAS